MSESRQQTAVDPIYELYVRQCGARYRRVGLQKRLSAAEVRNVRRASSWLGVQSQISWLYNKKCQHTYGSSSRFYISIVMVRALLRKYRTGVIIIITIIELYISAKIKIIVEVLVLTRPV
jgi:hypothetical protein